MIFYTLWYARRVKLDPSKSLSGISAEDAALAAVDATIPEKLTPTHKLIILLVVFTFALLAFSIVPWGAILNNSTVDPYTHKDVSAPFPWELGWWFPELSALFFVMAIAVGMVGRLGETATARAFIRGVVNFTGPAFLVVLARGVSVIMTNTKTIDTVLHAMERLITGTSHVVFVALLFVATLPLSFLVGGGSAGTALTIPVLAPLGDFAGVDRALVITTWAVSATWLRLILPINAILIAGLALADVRFDQYHPVHSAAYGCAVNYHSRRGPARCVDMIGTNQSAAKEASIRQALEPARSAAAPRKKESHRLHRRHAAARVRSLRGKRSHRTGSHPRGARASVATGWFVPFSARLARKGIAPPAEIAEHGGFHTICKNFAPPDACIMKQKLLNPPGDSEGQAGVEALRVALNC